MANKFYCYVDETGQDTEGKIFIVSILLFDKEREQLEIFLENLEKETGKGKFKWGKVKPDKRLLYLTKIFINKRFTGKLCYSIYKNSKDYHTITILSIAKAINTSIKQKNYLVTVLIDGLGKHQQRYYGNQLHHLGIHTRKIRGITKDENNVFIRLADSIAGFIRDILEGEKGKAKKLFEKAKEDKVIIEV